MDQYGTLLDEARSSDQEVKKKALETLNREHCLSIREIAKLIGASSSTLQRQFVRLGIVCLSKSEIQKHLLESGKLEHPTRGKETSQETKDKISDAIAEAWKTSEKMQTAISEAAKEQWANMKPAEKAERLAKASDGIREAAKNGSKLQNFLKDGLKDNGFTSLKDKVAVLPNQKLEFDIFIPEIRTIVEVDGPSHFRPIWGNDVFQKNLGRDNQKAGLALNSKFYFIRVKQTKNFSHRYGSKLLILLIDLLKRIKTNEVTELYHEISL